MPKHLEMGKDLRATSRSHFKINLQRATRRHWKYHNTFLASAYQKSLGSRVRLWFPVSYTADFSQIHHAGHFVAYSEAEPVSFKRK